MVGVVNNQIKKRFIAEFASLRLRFDRIMVMSLWPHFWPTLLYDVIYQTGASLRNSMITLPEADRATATGNTQRKLGDVRSEVCLLTYESRQTDKRTDTQTHES